MRVFLDVGANTGQTLSAVLGQGFDRIVCFEPAAQCWKKLDELAASARREPGAGKVAIERFGLWDRDCRHPLFQPGTQGGGLWKKDRGLIDATELCDFRCASDWTRANLRRQDEVFLKLNCEGAECDILDDLLNSGEFEKVTFLMVDFDVRKISALKHREKEIRARLGAYPFPRVAFCKDVMRGATHSDRIRHWLSLCR